MAAAAAATTAADAVNMCHHRMWPAVADVAVNGRPDAGAGIIGWRKSCACVVQHALMSFSSVLSLEMGPSVRAEGSVAGRPCARIVVMAGVADGSAK